MPIRVSQAEARRLAKGPQRAPKRPKGGTGITARAVPQKPAQSAGEAALAYALRLYAADLPAPLTQVRFAWPARKWASDFGWPAHGLLVEVDGGQWAPRGGRHNTDGDRDKLNHAAALGYRVLRFSPQQIEADPAGCIALVRRCLEGAAHGPGEG